jgi:UDP-N-acetylmuramate dehydrogenase
VKTASLPGELDRIEGLKVRTDVPLARLTTFKIGGPASILVTPETIDALVQAMKRIREAGTSTLVLGNGSNLLVSDEGFQGVVIRIGSAFGDMEEAGPDRLRIGAGTLWSKVLRYVMASGITGLEFGAGIPGTLGGAIATNAGTRGGQTADCLIEATVVDSDGSVREISRENLGFRYRGSNLPAGAVVASTLFSVSREDPAKVTETVRAYQAERRRDQPEREPSAGCIFKNPEGHSAGKLIDMAGLKGESVGGAIVSPIHGNFIINRGGARASDVLRLIDRIRERVSSEYSIALELEVRRVGFS